MRLIKQAFGLALLFTMIVLPCASSSVHENDATKIIDKSSHFVPFGLMVEFIREPGNVLIKDSLPEYNWIVPAEALVQNAYQILVSSTENNIDNNIGDVWNSGKIRSRTSSNIEHKGKVLKPDSRYFWKVRIWDKKNRASAYSEAQKFKTGVFSDIVSTENSFQIEKIGPKSIVRTSTDSYLVDFGQDAFGTLELNYITTITDTLIIRLGEKLNGMSIDRNPTGTIRYQQVKLPVYPGTKNYKLKLKPDSRNTSGQAVLLHDSLGVVTPFRYCELENFRNELKPGNIFQTACFSYFNYNESSFNCSDTILNQVWNLCKYSMKATSFTGLYIDGDRERIPYEADAYINQLGHYSTDREYAMARLTIEYFMTHPTWPTEWLLHTVLMVYQDYYYTGNTELLKRYYEVLKNKTLISLAREDGLISSSSPIVSDEFMKKLGFSNPANRIKDIVDWPPAQKDTGWKLSTPQGERDGHEMLPINTVVNCFFYINMVEMAELAGALNNTKDREMFLSMAEKVKNSINNKLFDRKMGVYIDGEGSEHASIHSNMLPLAFGVVPETNLKSVATFVKSRGMACSVYGAQYLLEGLYNAGEDQYALDLMRATTDRSWYNMIRAGSTIAMEAWDLKYKPNSDWNHAWGAVPANIIPRYLWGIRPETPGFEKILIDPRMGDLTKSSISLPTVKGKVEGNYVSADEQHKYFKINLPANVEGEFVIRNYEKYSVFLNGKKVHPDSERVRLKAGMNDIEISLKSF